MEKTKLNIAETLKQAFALYKQNFGALLKFALVSVLCGLPAAVISCFADELPESSRFQLEDVWITGTVLMVICSILILIVRLKNELGAQFLLAEAAANDGEEKPTMKRAYAKTKGRTAAFAGNYMLLQAAAGVCVFLVTSCFGVIFLFMETEQSWVRALMELIVNPFILPWSMLLVPAAAFEKQKTFKLERTSNIIKGTYLEIAVVALIGSGAALFSELFMKVLDVNPLIAFGITSAITSLTFGFNSAAAFVIYQTLRLKPEAVNAQAAEGAVPRKNKTKAAEGSVRIVVRINKTKAAESEARNSRSINKINAAQKEALQAEHPEEEAPAEAEQLPPEQA